MRAAGFALAVALAAGCFGSGGSDGGAGMLGAGAGGTGAGAQASGGTGTAATGGTGIAGASGGTGPVCGICSVPACAPGEMPRTDPGACCPSCGLVGGAGGTGVAGTGAGGAGAGAGGTGIAGTGTGGAGTAGTGVAGTGAAPQCGGLPCADGQICLTVQGQAAGTQRCEDDPCAPSPLACECAASLCDGEFNATECSVPEPGRVQCNATSSGCTPDGLCPP